MLLIIVYTSILTDCPPCYSLVQERVNIHRGKLRELNNLILNIGNDPDAFNDTHFTEQMSKVNDSINILLNEARGASSKYSDNNESSLAIYNSDKNFFLECQKLLEKKMSRILRKPDFCLCENKGADQLRGNREADQRLCFRYTDSTIPLLLKSEISSF